MLPIRARYHSQLSALYLLNKLFEWNEENKLRITFFWSVAIWEVFGWTKNSKHMIKSTFLYKFLNTKLKMLNAKFLVSLARILCLKRTISWIHFWVRKLHISISLLKKATIRGEGAIEYLISFIKIMHFMTLTYYAHFGVLPWINFYTKHF